VEYQTHVKHFKDLQDGKQTVLTIRDLSPGKHKYLARVARVQLSRSAEALAKGDKLWVRSLVGQLDPQPWGMKIVEEMGVNVPGKPYSDIYEALAKL
jgi:hypothetical protein